MVVIPESAKVAQQRSTEFSAALRTEHHDRAMRLLAETNFLARVISRLNVKWLSTLVNGLIILQTNHHRGTYWSNELLSDLREVVNQSGAAVADLVNAITTAFDLNRGGIPHVSLARLQVLFWEESSQAVENIQNQQQALALLARTDFLQRVRVLNPLLTRPQTLIDALTSTYLDEGVGYYQDRAVERIRFIDLDEAEVHAHLQAIFWLATSDATQLQDLLAAVEDYKYSHNAEPAVPAVTQEEIARHEFDFSTFKEIEIQDPVLHLSPEGERLVTFSVVPPHGNLIFGFGCNLTIDAICRGKRHHIIDTHLSFIDKYYGPYENEDDILSDYSPIRPQTITVKIPETITGPFKLYLSASDDFQTVTGEINYHELRDLRQGGQLPYTRPLDAPESI